MVCCALEERGRARFTGTEAGRCKSLRPGDEMGSGFGGEILKSEGYLRYCLLTERAKVL